MSEKGISESDSEKPPRGRPKRFSGKELGIARQSVPGASTPRTLQNVLYRLYAMHVLGDDPQFKWLFDKEMMWAGAKNSWRPGVLTELGRIAEDEEMRDIAAQVCEIRPKKAKDAITMIRRVRLGRAAPASEEQLTELLCRLIDDYRTQHPGVSFSQILDALHATYRVAQEVWEAKEGAEEGDEMNEAQAVGDGQEGTQAGTKREKRD